MLNLSAPGSIERVTHLKKKRKRLPHDSEKLNRFFKKRREKKKGNKKSPKIPNNDIHIWPRTTAPGSRAMTAEWSLGVDPVRSSINGFLAFRVKHLERMTETEIVD
jgi:hypothetical protein